MHTLKTITKPNNTFLYHVEARKYDQIEYVEMRGYQLNSNSIYRICTSIKCAQSSNVE